MFLVLFVCSQSYSKSCLHILMKLSGHVDNDTRNRSFDFRWRLGSPSGSRNLFLGRFLETIFS